MEHRRQFPLEPNGPRRLEVVMHGNMNQGASVFVDGALVLALPHATELRNGAALTLADGSQLSLRMNSHGGLDIRRNGIPVPECEADLKFTLGLAARWMFWVGGIGLAVQIERLLRTPPSSAGRTLATVEAAGDIVFLALAWLTKGGARWSLGVGALMTLSSAVLSWAGGRGVVATACSLLVFAFLAQRFGATSTP